MEHWRNQSLENLVEEYEGIVYKEKWKPVKGFEGFYEVSTFGRIRNIESNNWPQSIKAQRFPKNGYLLVSLWRENKEKKALTHRLVAIAFIPNPKNKKTVNHKKGIKTDNRAHQLEWATQGENAKHSYDELGRECYMTGKTGKDCRFSKPVNQYTKDGAFVARHDSATSAAKVANTSRRNISHNIMGNQKTAAGFIWKYV
jgi:hypothetical protein